MDFAQRRFQEARDQPQGRGLAAAGRAEQADQLAMVDPQADVIDHRQRSKPLGQAAQFNGRQSSSSQVRAVVGLLFIAGSIYEESGAGKAWAIKLSSSRRQRSSSRSSRSS